MTKNKHNEENVINLEQESETLKDHKVYKTEVIPYCPVASKMAVKIEDKCNEMSNEGFELVSSTITLGAKAILIFRK